MQKNIKELVDPKTGMKMHPITVADAVIMNNGTKLEDNIRYCKTRSTEIGNLDKLLTQNKHTLVDAINEILNKNYTAEYGVRFNGSDTMGERLGNAIGMEANFSIGNKSVVNDFDNVYPWRDMVRCNLDSEGNITAYENEPGFATDGSNGNVFVKIPKFYQKLVTDKVKQYTEYWISSYQNEGYYLNPAFIDPVSGYELDEIFVGCYEGTYDGRYLYSASGHSIIGLKTLDELRTLAKENGEGYHLCDICSRNIIEYLFLIEFATTNSQTVVKGNCKSSAYQTGSLDNYEYASGAITNTEYSPFKYRHMENIFGNSWEALDGIIIKNNTFRYETNYNNYGLYDTYTVTPLTTVQEEMKFFISKRSHSLLNPYVNIPIYDSELLSSNNTYFSDLAQFSDETEVNKIYVVGGSAGMDTYEQAGLFAVKGTYNLDTKTSGYTSRLCYKGRN